MRIKTKLTSGVGLLFLLIIMLSGVSVYYLNNLKRDTNNILTANYNSVVYARNMMLSLDSMPTDTTAFNTFSENLRLQLKNLTEPGEPETTANVSDLFRRLSYHSNAPEDVSSIRNNIRANLLELMHLNMNAIERKSHVANNTAQTAMIWVAITGVLCLLIAFVLLIKLPNSITRPIEELTRSIKEIANQNYHQRVGFAKHNEYGELAESFNTMAEKLEEYSNSKLAKILKEKKRVETLIENMHDPVIGLDESKNIIFVNNEAVNIFAVSRDHLIGRLATDVAIQNDLMRTLIARVVSSEKGNDSQLRIFNKGKESFFEPEIVNIEITPTGEMTSEFVGCVIILKNITPFKELDSAKSNFIATISHELKTPISSIKMCTQLLEHSGTGNLNEEQKHLVDNIKEDSIRLLKITGELLNISQAETGNIQLNVKPVNSQEMIGYAIDAVKTQCEQRNIKIISSIDNPISLINADIDKTVWVLINLLTNSIRYSPENEKVTINVHDEGNFVRFSVTNLGQKIDNTYSQRIFERYFKVPGTPNSGTGLGLAISKEFIEAQGGKIGLDTNQLIGSTFYFLLPKI